MKFATATSVALTAIVQTVNADFDLFAAGIGGNGISGNSWGWQVYDGVPDCDSTIDWIWRSSDDVSGGKYGVCCSGSDDACAGSSDPSLADEVEMNFNTDDHHWTTYKGRDWGLFDLDGNQVGSCEPIVDGEEFFCGTDVGRVEGRHHYHCTTDATSGDINDNRPQ